MPVLVIGMITSVGTMEVCFGGTGDGVVYSGMCSRDDDGAASGLLDAMGKVTPWRL